MTIDLPKFTAEELGIETLDQLIAQNRSFQVVAVSNIGATASKIEGRIEKAGLRSRTYTEYRKAALVTIFSPAAMLGLGAAVGMGLHNLVTYNPDYEIGKNKITGTVTVTYKK